MPIRLKLSEPQEMGRKTLIHGGHNAGKTFIIGSAMAHFHAQGKEVLYINLKGEGGFRTLTAFDIPEDCAMTVDSLKDFLEALKEAPKDGLLCVDSVKYIWSLAIEQTCGAKLPTVGGNSNDWSKIHHAGGEALDAMLDASSHVLAVCPSDRSMDQLKGSTFITPDLPGRMAAGIAGKFDLVGYMESTAMGSKVRRVLHFEPMTESITRIRGKSGFAKGIVLEEGLDVWAQVEKELEGKL